MGSMGALLRQGLVTLFATLGLQQIQAQAPVIVPPQNNTSSANPYLVTPCYVTGDPLAAGNNVSGEHVLVVAPYTATGKAHDGSGTALYRFANANQMGAVWGVTSDEPTNKIYSSAVLKRHVALGPNGLGAIYVSSLNTGNATTTPMTTSKFVDLVADLGIDVGQGQVSGMNLANGATSNVARGLPLDKTVDSADTAIFPWVGKIGLGDLDMDETHQNLFVVNLWLKKIHKIRISDASLVATYDIPTGDGAAGTTMRPWGLETAGGKLYAGVVYTEENPASGTGTAATMEGVIYQLDLTTGTWASSPVLSFPLDYPKGATYFAGSPQWFPWLDDFSRWSAHGGDLGTPFDTAAHPQPLISDLVMDTTGALHIAMMDRAGHQVGHRNQSPINASDLVTGMSGGDILRTWNNAGTIELESGGVAGTFTSSGTGTGATGPGGTSAPQGPGGGEFYWTDYVGSGGRFFHSETSFGGITMIRDSGEVVVSIMDPIDLDAGGWSVLSTANGAQVRDYQLYFDPSVTAYIGGKANGIGDLDVVAPPLVIPCPTITVTPDPLSSGTVGTAYTGSPAASGGTAPYTWTASGLPAGLSINASTGAITGNPSATGTATITATDANGCPGTTSLTINPFACPTIDVTPNPLPAGMVGTAYNQTPTASGAGGGASYTWSATGLPTGLSLNSSTGAITGTPTAAGNATITATYAGPGGINCTGSTTLTVNAFVCPTITVTPNPLSSGTVGTAYNASPAASGGTAPYSWTATSLPAGLAINATTGAITGNPTATGNATITATDANGCTGSTTLTINAFVCPTVTVTPNPLSSGTVGTAYTGSPAVSGGTAPYSWTATSLPSGLSINPTTGAITGNPTATGTATITATDANGCTGTTSLTINPFACPIITVTPNPLANGTVGTAYSASPTASGAPGGSSYAWTATGLPAGLILNATTGVISGTPIATGNATITATFSGPGGEQCQGSTTLAVTAAPCPTITVTPAVLPNGTVGTAYNQSLVPTGGTTPYTFAVTLGSLPAGLSLNGGTGAITGIPTSTSAASFTITATDANDCTGTRSFTVTPACPVITVTPNPLSSGTVGTAYTGSPSAGGGTAPYTWTATSLPAGLSISPSTGAITGNPTATGTATITATDTNGCTGTTSLTINPFACPTITVTPAILPEASVGQPYSETPTASGAGGGASYGWSATSLPAGLSINPTTGLISGTPTAEGTATITATYTGPGGELCTGTATLSIVNNCCPQLIFAVP